MIPLGIENQVATPPSVVCVSTHLDVSLWTAEDFTWSGVDWNRNDTLSGATSTLGPPKGGWNSSSNRPDTLTLGINIDHNSGMTFPTTIVVAMLDTDLVELGTANIVLTSGLVGAYTVEVALDYSGSAGSAGVGQIDLTPNMYSDGPRITCIELSGGTVTPPPVNKTIIIDETSNNLDLKARYEDTNIPAISGDTVTFIIEATTVIGSVSSIQPSLDTGSWATGVVVNVENKSLDIKGAGGNGGAPGAGSQGGTAFLVQSAINLFFPFGAFKGGGGGGAGTDQLEGRFDTTFCPDTIGNNYSSGGGGGAGNVPGLGGVRTPIGSSVVYNGRNGGPELGSSGGSPGSDPCQPPSGRSPDPNPPSKTVPCFGGAGGDLGDPGLATSDVTVPGSTGNIGGISGFSIDGFSLVTVESAGQLVGPTNG